LALQVCPDADFDGVPDLVVAAAFRGGFESSLISGRTLELIRPVANVSMETAYSTSLCLESSKAGLPMGGMSLVCGEEKESCVRGYSLQGAEQRLWKSRGPWGFGTNVSTIGDVNGDGVGDLVVTAPGSIADPSWAWVLDGVSDKLLYVLKQDPAV